MPDFFEIDFLAVETKKSGDAITIRYSIDGKETIHVVDGGFEATGKAIIKHLQEYYGQSGTVNISRVIVTHQDHDHTRGLRTVLEECNVGELWMLRPWIYSNELVDKFKRWTNPDNLSKRLKDIYPNILALEEIANRKGIPIYEPFQGKKIGEFLVLAPSKNRYLDLVAESEKTPDVVATESSFAESLSSIWNSVIHFINANWGDENLSKEPTSAENNMSVVQYASLNEQNILLTGDAGIETLCG
ncbi:MBL fold metallo-hydrolase [Actinobacillus pleuropneumoniae]|uniref:MBL fold metallo-hydrolase n=1 Tax=Actinobacillus pleuropneumoniae TaxID=715 RepID=UPI003F7BEB40